MKETKYVLTNQIIAKNYLNKTYLLMVNDFRATFAYWVVRQLNPPDYELIANSIKAYTEYLTKRYFKTNDVVIEMDCDKIWKMVDEDLFIAIPEIYALNQVKGDGYVDLGALSRNIFYDIIRSVINTSN